MWITTPFGLSNRFLEIYGVSAWTRVIEPVQTRGRGCQFFCYNVQTSYENDTFLK